MASVRHTDQGTPPPASQASSFRRPTPTPSQLFHQITHASPSPSPSPTPTDCTESELLSRLQQARTQGWTPTASSPGVASEELWPRPDAPAPQLQGEPPPEMIPALILDVHELLLKYIEEGKKSKKTLHDSQQNMRKSYERGHQRMQRKLDKVESDKRRLVNDFQQLQRRLDLTESERINLEKDNQRLQLEMERMKMRVMHMEQGWTRAKSLATEVLRPHETTWQGEPDRVFNPGALPMFPAADASGGPPAVPETFDAFEF